MARTRGHVDLKHRAEGQRVLLRADVLRDLLVVDQPLVQPARFAAAEDRRRDIRVGVARLVDRRGDPREIDARQLDAVGDDLAPLLRDLGSDRRDRRHRRAALQRPEVLGDERLRLRLVEVADDGEAGVVRRVVQLEEAFHIVQLRRLDVLMGADHVGVVGMVRRKQRLRDGFVRDAVRPILHALPPLVAHDVLLVRELRRVELVEQIPHAVGLQPQGELELIRRQRLEVVGAVEIGRAVDVAGAGGFEELEMRVGRHVLRALEHHVLEQVREPGQSPSLRSPVRRDTRDSRRPSAAACPR